MSAGREKQPGPLGDGWNDNGGFWQPALNRIGKRLTKAGHMTEEEWRAFSSDGGPWHRLMAAICNPKFLLMGEPELRTQARPSEASTSAWRHFVCRNVAKHPIAVPLFLADT